VITIKHWLNICAMAACLCLLRPGGAPAGNQAVNTAAEQPKVGKKIVLAQPVIKVFEVSAGGVPEQMDEWSARETDNVTRALFSHFSSTTKVELLKPDGEADRELKEIFALFAVICQSNALANGPSVGSIESLLQHTGGDQLLIVTGEDQFATSGKKAVNILGTITGVAASALTGVAVIPRMEGTMLRMALIDREGTVVWHSFNRGSIDLRNQEQCSDFVGRMMSDFPRPGK